MGHDAGYWIELEEQAKKMDVVHLIEELAAAYGKIGFYEKRLKEMYDFLAK